MAAIGVYFEMQSNIVSAGMVMEVRRGLEGSKASGIMRRRGRVNKLAGEWGRKDLLGQRG